MADFKFPINTNSSSVDEIISEAIDLHTLEQVSAINTSSFSNSLLSSDLETRFQRLKTFPSTTKTKPHLAPNLDNSSKHPSRSIRLEKTYSGHVPKSCNSKNSSNLKVKSGDEGKTRSGSLNLEEKKTGMGWLWCYPKRDSCKDKRKMMKEAMKATIKEAEKVRKESENVVKMAKRFAKSDFSFVDDDDGNGKRHEHKFGHRR